jgi:2'-5' RNA ligase superfamily
LAAIPHLDPVPIPWLHMTTQIVGFADEISDSEVDDLIGSARERMGALEPVNVALGRPLFHDEGLALGVSPRDGLDAVREGIREATDISVRANQLADDLDWVPHLSVAYSNSDAPAAPVIAAMRPPPVTVDVTIDRIDLVSQERVGHSYVWDGVAAVELGAIR